MPEKMISGYASLSSPALDGLAFVGDECERRMGTHGIVEFLKFAVDGVLPKARLEGEGI